MIDNQTNEPNEPKESNESNPDAGSEKALTDRWASEDLWSNLQEGDGASVVDYEGQFRQVDEIAQAPSTLYGKDASDHDYEIPLPQPDISVAPPAEKVLVACPNCSSQLRTKKGGTFMCCGTTWRADPGHVRPFIPGDELDAEVEIAIETPPVVDEIFTRKASKWGPDDVPPMTQLINALGNDLMVEFALKSRTRFEMEVTGTAQTQAFSYKQLCEQLETIYQEFVERLQAIDDTIAPPAWLRILCPETETTP